MKIIGYTYDPERPRMVLKGDSALLNGRKPFFLPDWGGEMEACPVLVMRVCRLGRSVSEKFAARYIDAVALGLDIRSRSLLADSPAEACSIEGSLPVGEWLPMETDLSSLSLRLGDKELSLPLCQRLPLWAIIDASRVMTIRQGDLIFYPLTPSVIDLQAEACFSGREGEREVFYCKIK